MHDLNGVFTFNPEDHADQGNLLAEIFTSFIVNTLHLSVIEIPTTQVSYLMSGITIINV